MIEANRLSKHYAGKPAVEQLNLSIQPGHIFCLLGANGAGKTTTINLFLNFVQPSEGTALINGIDVAKNPVESKRFLAYVPENLQLYPNLTGLENLDYFSGLANRPYSKAELCGLLATAGLQEDAFAERVHRYSKGMRQKVGIAIALAKGAKALLLDEPTSGLDPKAANEFAGILRRLSEEGVAILMATHDLFRAKETGTHIGIMRDGKLVENLNPGEIGHADLERLYLTHMN
jgi:ABC-2 type transport system ATP-binding protein